MPTPRTSPGSVMTRRLKAAGRSTVSVSYSTSDAQALRTLIDSIRIKGDRKPTMSLIARRSIQVYLTALTNNRTKRPDLFAAELAELEAMVTRHPEEPRNNRRSDAA